MTFDRKPLMADGKLQTTRRHFLFNNSMLVLLGMVWGLTFPATKAALAVTDPIQFLTMRFLLAAVIMLPFILRKMAGQKPGLSDQPVPLWLKPKTWNIWYRGFIVGLFLLLGFILQVEGLRFTTASRSGFFTGLLVPFTPLLAALFRTSRVPLLTWFGLPFAFLGVFLISEPNRGGVNIGDVLTIACAVVFAMQMVLLEHISRDRDDITILTFAQIAVIAAGGIVWSLIESVPLNINGTTVSAVVYTGIFGSIVAVYMQTKFQPRVPAGHAALIFASEPIFASVFAWILLGETWTVTGLFGAGLIFTAMVLSGFGMGKTQAHPGGQYVP